MEHAINFPHILNGNDSTSRDEPVVPQKNLFNSSPVQISRSRSKVTILHKMNLKQVALEALQQKPALGLSKEDLGKMDHDRTPNTQGDLMNYGENWGKAHLAGPIWIQYDLKVSRIKMTHEDDISEDEEDPRGKRSPNKIKEQSLSTHVRFDSESEYKPSDTEDRNMAQLAIGNDGLVADIQIDEIPESVRNSEQKEITENSENSDEKITFDLVFEISVKLLLEESHGNQNKDFNFLKQIPISSTLYSVITKKKISETFLDSYGLFSKNSNMFTKKYVIYQTEEEFAVLKTVTIPIFVLTMPMLVLAVPPTKLRLFAFMDNSRDAASLKKLVEAFGWTRNATFVQQDIQEFCCLLMDNLEQKFASFSQFQNPFQNSSVFKEPADDNLIRSLFNGETESLVECRDVEYISRKTESFLDIQLSLKTFQKQFHNLEDSLREYVIKEPLDGDNKYMTDDKGKQDADRRTRFTKLPKILMFHLRRSMYDFQLDLNAKITHRFEFPRELDMDDFKDEELRSPGGNPYRLLGIFVHHGMEGVAGHYTVLIEEDDGWYEYDDENARKVDWQYVQDNAFGGEYDDMILDRYMRCVHRKSKRNTHAYMLIYIDKQYEEEILNCPTNQNRKSIGMSVRKFIESIPNPQPSLFVNRCIQEKSFQNFSRIISHNNNLFYRSQLLQLSVMSPWQLIGEPTAQGAIVSSQHQKDGQAHRRPLHFRKFVCGQDFTEILISQTSNQPEAPVLAEPRPTREMIENERLMKARAERIQLDNPDLDKLFYRSGFIRTAKGGAQSILGPLLKDTPDYLNYFPDNQKPNLNILHQRKHLLSLEFLSKVYDTENPINIDKNNFFQTDFEDTSCAFSTFVTPNLPLFALKLHLLFKDQENEEYLDFNRLNSQNANAILSAFEFFQLVDTQNLTLHKLNLDSYRSFANSLQASESLHSPLLILAAPKTFIQSSESPFSHKLPHRNVFKAEKRLSLDWVLSNPDSSFNQYLPKNVFSTQVKLPCCDSSALNSSQIRATAQHLWGKGSSDIDPRHSFAQFIKMNLSPSQFEPETLSLSFLNSFRGRPSTPDRPEPIICENPSPQSPLRSPILSQGSLQTTTSLAQIKIFLPHMNILYTYGFLRVPPNTSARSLSKLVGSFIQHDLFYLFQEKFTPKNSFSHEPFPNLTFLPINTSHSGISSIWNIILKILTNRFHIDYVENNKIQFKSSLGQKKETKKSKQFELSTDHVESLIVVPSSVFFNRSLEQMKISPPSSQIVPNSQKLFDSKSTNKQKSDFQAIVQEIKISSGKRPHPGHCDDPESNPEIDNPNTKKQMKKVKIDSDRLTAIPAKSEASQDPHPITLKTPPKAAKSPPAHPLCPSKQLKQSLLYLELTHLFGFLDLFHKFSNFKYFKIFVENASVERHLIISAEWDNDTIFNTIYGKVYQEQNFFKFLMNRKALTLLNGHFFYGNSGLDLGMRSLLNSNQPIMQPPYTSFDYFTLWGIHSRRNRISEKQSQKDHFKVNDQQQLDSILRSPSLQPFESKKYLQTYEPDSTPNRILQFALQTQKMLSQEDAVRTARFLDLEESLNFQVTTLCRDFQNSVHPLESEALITDWIDTCGSYIRSKIHLKIQSFFLTWIPLFSKNDLKFPIQIPEDNFSNKMELVSDILTNNNDLMVAIMSDELQLQEFQENSHFTGGKFGWFNETSLQELLFSNERNRLSEFSDIEKIEDRPLTQEHFDTNFRDILLKNMFQVLNLELFKGSIADMMLYPANDGLFKTDGISLPGHPVNSNASFDQLERKYLPHMVLMKVLTLSPQFIHSWTLAKQEVRPELTVSVAKKYLKQFQRIRKTVLKERLVTNVRQTQDETPLELSMFNLFPHLKLVFVYVVSPIHKILAMPRAILVPGCFLVSEMYSIILKLFEENIQHTLKNHENHVIQQVTIRSDDNDVDYEEVSHLRIDDHEVVEDIFVKFILVIDQEA